VCGKKIGVKSHTPYDEVLQIAKEKGVDMIVTLGSSSYSDAAKAALIIHASLPVDQMAVDSMESLNAGSVDDKTGEMNSPATVKDPTLKLICVPTSFSRGVERKQRLYEPDHTQEIALRPPRLCTKPHCARPAARAYDTTAPLAEHGRTCSGSLRRDTLHGQKQRRC